MKGKGKQLPLGPLSGSVKGGTVWHTVGPRSTSIASQWHHYYSPIRPTNIMGLLSFSAPWFPWKMVIIHFHLQHWIYRNKSWKQSTSGHYFPCPSPANWGLWRIVVSYASVCHSALFKLKCKSFQDKSSVFSTLCPPSPLHCIRDYEHLREVLWGFADIFWGHP